MKKISVLTWNIWFDMRQFNLRIPNIIKEILNVDAAVVGLQEVTLPAIKAFASNNKLSTRYKMYYDKSLAEEKGAYGELFLVKRDIKCTFKSVLFPNTNMGRRLNKLYIPTLSLEIYTFHLESVFRTNKQPKLDQFKLLINNMSHKKNPVIMFGDTNLDEQDDVIIAQTLDESPFTDIYKTMPAEKRGPIEFTYDVEANSNVLGNYRSRLDRIYCNHLCTPNTYKVVGMASSKDKVYPSDHFGVYSEVSMY